MNISIKAFNSPDSTVQVTKSFESQWNVKVRKEALIRSYPVFVLAERGKPVELADLSQYSVRNSNLGRDEH